MKVKKILVSQPQPTEIEKTPYGDLIKKHNIHFDFYKFFKIESLSTREFRDEKVYINEYTAVIFSSKHAIDFFFNIAKEVRVEVPESMKYFCISESVALYLQKHVQYRKRKIFHADQDVSQLMDLIKKHKCEKFLVACSETGNRELSALLEASKIIFTEARLYRLAFNNMKELVNMDDYDMLVFFSPQGIKSLFFNWPDFVQNDMLIATFGATTQQAAIEAGLKVEVFAPTAQVPSMTMAIDQFLCKYNKK